MRKDSSVRPVSKPPKRPIKTNLGFSVWSKEDARVCNLFINTTLLSEGYRCDKQECVPFTEDELRALQLLLREELYKRHRPTD
jgi:hypothetical protein